MDVLKKAVAFTLKWEGGRSDDIHDPGGRTAFGITQKVFDMYCDEAFLPRSDVFDIPMDTVEEIYEMKYFIPAGCKAINNPNVAIAHFDCAVNTGIDRSTRILQTVIGSSIDGKFGPSTLDKTNKAGDCSLAIIAGRQDFYHALAKSKPNLERYLKGWINRTEDLIKYLGTLHD